MSETPMKPETEAQPISIVRAVPSDAERICEIRDVCWIDTYPNEKLGITKEQVELNARGQDGVFVPRRIAGLSKQIAKEDGEHAATFVAKQSGNVIGFTEPKIEETGRRMISTLYVDPNYQGQGAGKALFKAALDWLGDEHEVFLEVVEYNQRAIALYEKYGFIKTGTYAPEEEGRPDYMTDIPNIEMLRPKNS